MDAGKFEEIMSIASDVGASHVRAEAVVSFPSYWQATEFAKKCHDIGVGATKDGTKRVYIH